MLIPGAIGAGLAQDGSLPPGWLAWWAQACEAHLEPKMGISHSLCKDPGLTVQGMDKRPAIL